MYSTENSTQYLEIAYVGKEYKNSVLMNMYN